MSVMLKDVYAYRSVTNVFGDSGHLKVTCMCTLENMHAHNVWEKHLNAFFNHRAYLHVNTAECSQSCNMSQRLPPAQFLGLLQISLTIFTGYVEQVTIEYAQIDLQTLIFVMELTFGTKLINSTYNVLYCTVFSRC